MRIIKRRITVNGVNYDIWLGLTTRTEKGRATYHIHYYPNDPNDKTNSVKPVSIKAGFQSERAAIEHGKEFMKDLYIRVMTK